MLILKKIPIPIILCLFLISCEETKTDPNYEITFSPAILDFGLAELNTTVDATVLIINSASSSGTFRGLLEIRDTPGFSYFYTKEITLLRGESKQVPLSFTPTENREYVGRLILIEESGNFDYFYELPIKGLGAEPVQFGINKLELIYGLVGKGSFKDLSITLQNFPNSGYQLDLSLLVLGAEFSLPDGKIAYLVPVNSSVIIPVRYTPSSLSSTGTLSIQHNSSLIPNPLNISLSGSKDNSADVISLITTGWNNFQNGNYTDAMSGFQSAVVIVSVSTLYDSLHSEILLGRGWTHAFLRNYEKSVEDLLSVFQDYSVASNQTRLDAVAGLTIMENLLSRYEQVIEHSTYILTNTINYIFTYKGSIDHKDIRLARAQAYFNTGDFLNTANDLDILIPADAPHSPDPRDLLLALQNYAGGS